MGKTAAKTSDKAADKPSTTLNRLGVIALFAPLFAILAATVWYAARAWISTAGPPMPVHGYIAMTLGVVFSLAIGCGLMTLLFYSSRHGYDDIGYDEPDRTKNEGDCAGAASKKRKPPAGKSPGA